MSAQKPKDPNWVCTFELVRNPDKTEDKHPDFVHPPSKDKNTGQVKLNKAGKPMKKNFTIGKDDWVEASGYIQKDKTIKITIKRQTKKPSDGDDFMDRF